MNIRTSFSYLVLGIAILLILPSWATAQNPNCGPRDVVIAKIQEQFGEVRQSAALGNNNMLIETYASHETGTWTIIASHPKGITCILIAGQAFQTMPPVPTGDPA